MAAIASASLTILGTVVKVIGVSRTVAYLWTLAGALLFFLHSVVGVVLSKSLGPSFLKYTVRRYVGPFASLIDFVASSSILTNPTIILVASDLASTVAIEAAYIILRGAAYAVVIKVFSLATAGVKYLISSPSTPLPEHRESTIAPHEVFEDYSQLQDTKRRVTPAKQEDVPLIFPSVPDHEIKLREATSSSKVAVLADMPDYQPSKKKTKIAEPFPEAMLVRGRPDQIDAILNDRCAQFDTVPVSSDQLGEYLNKSTLHADGKPVNFTPLEQFLNSAFTTQNQYYQHQPAPQPAYNAQYQAQDLSSSVFGVPTAQDDICSGWVQLTPVIDKPSAPPMDSEESL